MMKNPGRQPSANVDLNPTNLEQEIRRRAYELYEERGREDGHELDDWLRAEEQVKARQARSIAA
jgi:hypothetical protein